MGITFSFAEKKWICFNDVIEGEYALLVIYLVCEGSSTPLATKALAYSHCMLTKIFIKLQWFQNVYLWVLIY